MDFEFTPEQEEFRWGIQQFIAREATPALREELRIPEGWIACGPAGQAFLRKLGAEGWLGVSWPKKDGGKGLPLVYQHILIDELSYNGLLYGHHAVNTLGPIIARAGSEEQRDLYLPPILRGELQIALGYAEPEAGTDLASVQTRAVRDGDDYVINGEKLYCTGAQATDYIWLLARTDPQAPKHKGLSVFLVPSKSPGITYQFLWCMSGDRTTHTWLRDVRVPSTALIGPENQGWYVTALALDFQRVTVGARTSAIIRRQLDMAIQYATETTINGRPLATDPAVRHLLAELFVEAQAARLFAYRCTWMVDRGMTVDEEAAMAKAWSTEVSQRVLSVALQLMGPYGQVQPGSPRAPLGGSLEVQYRGSFMPKFGGGASEIQRNIIAERGLGLPR